MNLGWNISAFPRYANPDLLREVRGVKYHKEISSRWTPKHWKTSLRVRSEWLCCLETRSVCLMFCIMSYPLWNLCCWNFCMYDSHWTCRSGRLPLLQRIGVIYLQLTVDDNEVLVRWVTGLLFSQEESQWGSSLLAHGPSGSPIMFNKECKSTVSY